MRLERWLANKRSEKSLLKQLHYFLSNVFKNNPREKSFISFTSIALRLLRFSLFSLPLSLSLSLSFSFSFSFSFSLFHSLSRSLSLSLSISISLSLSLFFNSARCSYKGFLILNFYKIVLKVYRIYRISKSRISKEKKKLDIQPQLCEYY